jgi:hypothetical protein
MGGRRVLCEMFRNRVIFVKVRFMGSARMSTDLGCGRTFRVL